MTDRGTDGKFIKGKSGNPKGRPTKATEQEYQDALYDVVPLDRWKRILEAQMKRAERGDIQAFNAIANRILPIMERHEHTGRDGDPIEIRTFDYANAITTIAAGSDDDSGASGES